LTTTSKEFCVLACFPQAGFLITVVVFGIWPAEILVVVPEVVTTGGIEPLPSTTGL
jgi:hypothetical protein